VFDHVSFDTPLDVFENAPIRPPRESHNIARGRISPHLKQGVGAMALPMGLHVELFGEVVGSRPEVSRKIYDELRHQKKIHGAKLHITPHAIHTVPPEILKEIFLNEPKPFSIHMNESQAEMDYFQNRGPMWHMICEITKNNGINPHGKTQSAITYCAENGLSLDRCLIVHANYLSDEDVEILKGSKNICVVHCPSSHAFFGHQPFPYNRLREAGIPVALGTDSVCSGSTLSMQDEVRLFWSEFPGITKEEMIQIVCHNALIPFAGGLT
jgi:cytosine/adenosine deaminase-related metal-dependent hydrolase